MANFEEYKLFTESTQYLSERRQAATSTQLVVNTAIFTVLAFLLKDTGLRGWSLVGITFPLFVAGVLACGIWYKMISQYKDLIGWRYDQLMEMERAADDSYQMYVKEYEEFFKRKRQRDWFGFSRLEIWLPRLFLGLYLIYLAGLILTIAFNSLSSP